MKDLQSYLDELTIEQVNEMAEFCQAQDIPEDKALMILNFLKKVYESEMDVDFSLDDELIKFVSKDLGLKLSMYIGVRAGDMEIKSGRIMLIKNEVDFGITEQGIKRVEAMGKK